MLAPASPSSAAGTRSRNCRGWTVDAETIRRLCHAEAAECRKTRDRRLKTAEVFAKAKGNHELQIDAGKVNTKTGWRDVKVATFAVREPGRPATSQDFKSRELPKPSVRHVVASIEGVEAFGPRCRAESARIGLLDTTDLTILWDGAEWIWNLASDRFAAAAQTLDVFHATQYLGYLT